LTRPSKCLEDHHVGPFTLRRHIVPAKEFVERWEPLYNDPLEDLYSDHVGRPLTPESVRLLFEWKNGGKLSRFKQASVEVNYVGRLDELRTLPHDTPATEFLKRFDNGGAIWRIYFLHIWAPHRYPIYDQHVHRAMALIETGRSTEIPRGDGAKIAAYLDRFVPFYSTFHGLEPRRVDKALWACGKYMKGLAAAPVD
jgi:hypothetical protein